MNASALAFATLLVTTALCAAPALASPATDAYAANIRIEAEYLAQAGGLAGTRAESAALKSFGADEASQQAAVIGDLDSWQKLHDQASQQMVVADAETAVQTGRSVGEDTYEAPIAPGVLMPAAAMSLARLDALKGADFDAAYKPLQIGVLKNLIGFYDAYSRTGDDAGLRAAALRELPKVKASLAAIEAI